MSKKLLICAASLVIAAPALLSAAEGDYSEKETHVARGLSERMNTMNRFNKLAQEKGSSELVRNLAKVLVDENQATGAELSALSKSIGITGVGGGGPGGPGPQGAPGAGAVPAGAPGGGAPGGARGPGGGGGGPSSYANRYYTQLQGLSGEAFDEMYLLRVLQYQEDIERSLNDEIRSGQSPELMAWSREKVIGMEARAQLVQRILYGEQKEVPATGTLKAVAPARRAAAGGAMPPKP